MVNLVSTRTPTSSLQSCFPAHQSPACTGVLGYFSPGAGLVFPFVDLYEISLCPFPQTNRVLLNGRTTIWSTTPSEFLPSPNLQRVHSVPSSMSLVKILHDIGSQYRQLWYSIIDLPPAELHAADHNPLISAIQPVFNPLHCTFIIHVHVIIFHASLFPDLFVGLFSCPNSYVKRKYINPDFAGLKMYTVIPRPEIHWLLLSI